MTLQVKRIVAHFVCITGVITFGAVTVFGQTGVSNARSAAMGGAYSAIANGVEAPLWNPANLGIRAKAKYRLNLFSFGLGVQNNSFSKTHYNKFNGALFSANDKKEILNLIPEEGLTLDLNGEVQALGISIDQFAFTTTGIVSSNLSIPDDLFDLLLNGNQFDKSYDLSGAKGEGIGYASTALSAGIPITLERFKEFSIGVSGKYLQGFSYAKVVQATSSLETNIDGIHSSGQLALKRAESGDGFGIDLGVAAKVDKNTTLNFSVINLFSNINWDGSPERFTYTFGLDSLTVQKASEDGLDSLFADKEETVDIKSFSTSLPGQIHLGAARKYKKLLLGFTYTQGLRNGAGVSTTPRLAFGTEYRPIGFFPLRAGFAMGGGQSLSSSLGFAFDFALFSWDFALVSRSGMFAGKGISLAFGWMFRF